MRNVLPLALLLVHVVMGIDYPGPIAGEVGVGWSRFLDDEDVQAARYDEDKKPSENFDILSRNYASRVSFRYGAKTEAYIERLNFDGSSKSRCSIPAFEDERLNRRTKLQSLGSDIEILYSWKNDTTYLLVLNMTDCQYTENKFPRDRRCIDFAIDQKDYSKFDIFTINGTEECGSYVCKRTYYFESKSISEPSKFYFYEHHPEWKLIFIESSAEGEYFAVAYKDGKFSLMSLGKDGSLIKAIDNCLKPKAKLLDFSTYNGYFGYCYANGQEIYCSQVDRLLSLRYNQSYALGYEPRYLEVYNTKEGYLAALTARCYSDEKSCESREIKLARFSTKGKPQEFSSFREECPSFEYYPYKSRYFTFFEEEGKICLFYECNYKSKEESGLKTKCFSY